MADGSTFYSLISGISGALIGGLAGVYGPGQIDRRRRRHEIEMDRAQTLREDERRSGEMKEERLQTLADTSVSVQDWFRLVAWTIQDLQVGRAVEVAMYDEKAEPALQAVVRAVSLVNFSPRLRNTRDANGTADRGRPVTVEMHELTRELRARILAPDAVFDNADLSSRAKAIRDSLVDFLAYERQVFIGNATQMNYAPIIWTRSVTPPDGHTPSNARGAPDDGQPGSGE